MLDTAEGKGTATTLAGLRVLVAEDRSLIAAKIVQILRRAGCAPVGPVATLRAGLDLTRREEVTVDAAVLDIDLRGETVYPLAEALRARGAPFLFLTGYGKPVTPAPWRDVVRIEKPFDEAVLLGGLCAAITRRPSGPVVPDAPPGRALPD